MQVIDPRELNDLAAFASRGGLGRGVALTDCVAEQPDQLMYFSGDSLILLRDLGDVLLASCEGVVGWVERDHVRFEGLASASAKSGDLGEKGKEDGELPRSIIVQSPSPPMAYASLPGLFKTDGELEFGTSGGHGAKSSLIVDKKEADKRASNPFDLDSPLATPSVESTGQGFQIPPTPLAPARPADKGGETQEELMDDTRRTPGTIMTEDPRRESMESVNSSSFGGIGGFMMGGSSFDEHEYGGSPGLTEMADSPITPGHSVQTPQSIIITTPSKPHTAELSPTSLKSPQSAVSWDIYDTYSQSQPLDSPYAPQINEGKRKETHSMQSNSSSSSSSPIGFRNSVMTNSSWDDEGRAFEAARLALERVGKGRKWVDEEDEGGRKISGEMERKGSVGASEESHTGSPNSVESATAPPPRPARRRPMGVDMPGGVSELREGEQNLAAPSTPKLDTEPAEINREEQPSTPLATRKDPQEQKEDDLPPLTPRTAHRKEENTPKRLIIANPDSGDEEGPDEVPSAGQSSDGNHVSDVSTEIVTPHTASGEIVPTMPPTEKLLTLSPAEMETAILPSPLDNTPINRVEPVIALTDPSQRTESITLRTPGPPSRKIAQAHGLPMVPPINTFQSGSPSSPHSVDATRRAVEAVRKTPEATRKRGMTLMGRMEADLGQAKGPVPITFLVGDNFPPPLSPAIPAMGYGVPPGNSGRISPAERKGSAPSPLAPPFMDTSVDALKTIPSPYPFMRSATNPLPPPAPEITTVPSAAGSMPKPGFFPRPRSRSFSAAVSKVIAKKAGPGLTIKTDIPAVPSSASKGLTPTPSNTTGGPVKRPFFSRQASMPSSATLAPSASSSNLPIPTTPVSPAISLSPDIIGIINHVNGSNVSLAPPSARSSSFSFRKVSRGSKTSLGPNNTTSPTRPLPSPVSNKDYEDTVKADGLDFEIIQPKRGLSGSTSDNTLNVGLGIQEGAELERKGTVISSTSGRSLRTLPDTDEWGFIKDNSPTPEIFTGRAGGAGQRALEQKWLSTINTPFTNGQPPKKIRRLAIEGGIPASLRGRVWAWFMMPIMSARRPGLYQELLEHDREDKKLAQRIDTDVEAAYPDHSIYSETSTGQSDLRSILRAYSHFATGGYRSEMALIAGMLLIHCVAEDAFWLLSGFVNGVLKDYYASPTGGGPGMTGGKAPGIRIDAAVFAGVLHGSEPKLARLFKDIGLHPMMFLEEWYTKLFIRCLPWPTALRIIDAVVAEGPRFLLIASLTILTLSRDRLLALPRTYTDVLAYLRDLPQDALLLPEPFMKACENVKFREEDLMRLRKGVEKELGL